MGVTPISEKTSSQESSKATSSKVCGKKFKSVYEQSSSKKKSAREKEEQASLLSPFELIQQKPSACFSSDQISASCVSVEIEALFEEMITVMTSLHENGIQETTFYLDANSSIFSGMQITIKEFSTAPKIFNVELIGSPEAAQLLQANMAGLIEAFNREERKFKINRLETHHSSGKKRSREKELDTPMGEEYDHFSS
jgi:hypothetical protein